MTVRNRARNGAALRKLPRNWRSMRLEQSTARAVARMISWAKLGVCDVLPGPAGWLVLLEPEGAQASDGLLCLTTLGEAAAFLRQAWRWDGPAAGPTRFNGEAQVRQALLEVTAGVLAKRGDTQ